MDVPKDDFVFSFHILGDALLLDLLLKALQGHKQVEIHCSPLLT